MEIERLKGWIWGYDTASAEERASGEIQAYYECGGGDKLCLL